MSQHNMEMVRSAYERFQATGDYLAWIVKLDRATRMEMYAHPLEVLAAARLRE